MATVYDIIKGISQAAANAYDGAQYENLSADGKTREAGLKREMGDPIVDSRVMDGFGVKFHGDQLLITYQSEIPIKEFHNSKYDEEVEQTYSDIVKFLKKEYKAVTGESLSLTAVGPADIHLQNMSRVRSWAQATKAYKIGNMDGVVPVEDQSEDRLEANFRKFLELSTDKKPQNVTRKGEQ